MFISIAFATYCVYIQESRYLKMEKADILEMTVAYLRTVYQSPPTTTTSDAVGSGKYAAGYRQCVVEVAHYLDDVASGSYSDGLVNAVRTKLMRHLTAVLHTKVFRRPDDNDRLCPVMTSLPVSKAEVRSRSCCSSSDSSCAGRGRTSSSASSVPSVSSDLTAVSPSLPVGRTLGQLAASQDDRAVVGCLAVGSPSSADRDEASDASAACVDFVAVRSVDGCVWRPW